MLVARRNLDGSIGQWTNTSALPDFRAHFTPVFVDGRIYVIGGHRLDGIAEGSSTSYVASVLSNGSLGAWLSATPMPFSNFDYGAVYTSGRIYIVGGSNGFGPRSDVIFAAINPDGSLGPWSSTSSLPIASENLVVFAFGDYLYAMAGVRTGTAVFVTHINTDGTLGAWTTTTPLPFSFFDSGQGVLIGDQVFIIGSQQVSSTERQVSEITSTVNPNGSLMSWSTDMVPGLPPQLVYFGFSGDQKCLYVIGGGIFNGVSRTASAFYTSPATATPETYLSQAAQGKSWTYNNPNWAISGTGQSAASLTITPAEDFQTSVPGTDIVSSFQYNTNTCSGAASIGTVFLCADASLSTAATVAGDLELAADLAGTATPGGLFVSAIGSTFACNAVGVAIGVFVGNTWKTITPTSVQLIQAGSGAACQLAFSIAADALLGTPIALIATPTVTTTTTVTTAQTVTGPGTIVTTTQTVMSTTQGTASMSIWVYATMVLLLIVGLAVGYIIKRPSVNKP